VINPATPDARIDLLLDAPSEATQAAEPWEFGLATHNPDAAASMRAVVRSWLATLPTTGERGGSCWSRLKVGSGGTLPSPCDNQANGSSDPAHRQ
jgi:hypothetical protein